MKKNGFTLIEILIAMAIFSMIAVGATQILTRVTDSNELSNERFEQLRELQRAMLIMERDFLQMVPRRARINGESSAYVLTGGQYALDSEADAVAFVRSGWQNPQLRLARSELQAVAYRLREGKLERLHQIHVDSNNNTDQFFVRTLLSEVENLRIELLTEMPNSKFKWNELEEALETLPLGIAIEIDSKVYGSIRREFKVGA